MDNNPRHSSIIKHEYLPPPLQSNYLSLFDIQFKMAKEFLSGTEEEKIAIVKKRIKKFFDYGKDQTDVDQLSFEPVSREKTQYPPFQAKCVDINENLEIDSSKIIIYGKKSVTFEIVEKIFPGFIGFDKIDDCNARLSFASEKECRGHLLKNVKNMGNFAIENIEHPHEIQWFEIQMKPSQDEKIILTFYARFVTNKDDILFSNDHYFRKLLGKARKVIDIKKQQEQNQKKDLQLKAEMKAFMNRRKMYRVKRYDQKINSKDFDTVTNYDGVYVERPYQRNENSQEACYFESREQPWFQEQKRMLRRNFDELNLSQIRPIELEGINYRQKQVKRERYRSHSRNSFDEFQQFHKKQKPEFSEVNLRDRLIKSHRQKSSSKALPRGASLELFDYNKEIESKLMKGNKPHYEVD